MPAVDSGSFLRHRGGSDCDYRSQRVQTDPVNSEKRLAIGALFAALAITTAWTESEIIWLFILCGFIAMLAKAPPRWGRAPTVLRSLAIPAWLLVGIYGGAGRAGEQ
jgi:hypothetical protein